MYRHVGSGNCLFPSSILSNGPFEMSLGVSLGTGTLEFLGNGRQHPSLGTSLGLSLQSSYRALHDWIRFSSPGWWSRLVTSRVDRGRGVGSNMMFSVGIMRGINWARYVPALRRKILEVELLTNNPISAQSPGGMMVCSTCKL